MAATSTSSSFSVPLPPIYPEQLEDATLHFLLQNTLPSVSTLASSTFTNNILYPVQPKMFCSNAYFETTLWPCLFSEDTQTFVPILINSNHYVLLIINPHEFCYFNSMGENVPPSVKKKLEPFRHPRSWRLLHTELSHLQVDDKKDNFSCGLWVIESALAYCKDPIKFVISPVLDRETIEEKYHFYCLMMLS